MRVYLASWYSSCCYRRYCKAASSGVDGGLCIVMNTAMWTISLDLGHNITCKKTVVPWAVTIITIPHWYSWFGKSVNDWCCCWGHCVSSINYVFCPYSLNLNLGLGGGVPYMKYVLVVELACSTGQ